MIKIGDRIDERYHITGKIAHGGMADVYEAYDTVKRRTVSLKVMREDMMKNEGNLARFERECIAAASLNNPNVVKVYGSGVIEGRPYMVNEYIRGQTLREKLNFSASNCLSVPEAISVMLQLCNGMSYIHKHGIVHRDIKPDNLFYLADGSIKVADFGISTTIGEKAKGQAINGTVHYAAPEILLGKPSNPSADIYAMGIMFYEIVVGSLPFNADTAEDVAVKQIKEPLPLPSTRKGGIPKAIDSIIIKATRKRPDERYHTVDEMKKDIESIATNPEAIKEKRGIFSRIFGLK